MNISKLLKKYKYTRSPYIFYDDNMPSMYFTVLQNDKWNLYFTDNKEVQKVDFLQDYSIKQVTCYKKQDLYCVSFCGEMGGTNSLFYTETNDPIQFKIITSVAHDIKTGVVTQSKIIVVNQENEILIYEKKDDIILQKEKPIQRLTFDLKDVTHITFLNGDQNQLLIAYRDMQYPERHGTIYVNLTNIPQQKQILTEDNAPIYDVTIDPMTNEILYSKRTGLRKFHRKIAKTFLKNLNSNNVSLVK